MTSTENGNGPRYMWTTGGYTLGIFPSYGDAMAWMRRVESTDPDFRVPVTLKTID